MLSIELFDSKYERRLHEGAVDQLEQHRIDVLNDRMQELLSRAKESRYKNDPAALDSLKKQYQKIKDERDSYYKVRESKPGTDIVDVKQKMKALTPAKPGVAGAVKDVAQGLKNFLQGKPETGPTYEGVVQDALRDYLGVTGESDADAVRAAIDKIGRDPTLKPTSKRRLIGQIGMMVNKHQIPVGHKYYQYMQKFMEQSMSEDDIEDFLKAGGKIQYGKPQKGPRRPGLSLASRHIGGGGDKMRPSRSGMAGAAVGAKPIGIREESSTSSDAVERAILNRIMISHTDLLKQYGPQKVMQAAEEVAYNVGDVDEIGSSDVSAYVAQVEQILGAVQEAKDKPSLRDPKDNPCWKGYHPVGTKQKGGRTVPNCVPKD